MKDASIIDLIERLRQVKAKADKLAAEQHELKQELETAIDKAHELRQQMLEERNDLGGEA
jgi:seryl-tRNA synthetase